MHVGELTGYRRLVRVVRVDRSLVESTKYIVESKNASHYGDLENISPCL